MVVDLEGRIVRFNDTLVTPTGIADDERVRGLPFAAVFAAGGAQEQVARLIAEQAPSRHEHRWIGRNGEKIVVEWSLTPITDEQGDPRLPITGLDVRCSPRTRAGARTRLSKHGRQGDAVAAVRRARRRHRRQPHVQAP
jgi:PAS domain S-box-containing protein